MTTPAPHPDSECPFYQGVYQNYLIATMPSANGDPAIVSYATVEDAFLSARPSPYTRNTGDLASNGAPLPPSQSPDPYINPGGAAAAASARQGPPTGKAWLGTVHQPGQRNVLVDQNHHTLYYGLHMNQAFVDFIKAENLQTVNGIMLVDPNLEFPPGLVEFKTAWTDIDPRDFPDANGSFGTANGIVPPPTDFASDPGDYSNYIKTMAWLPYLSLDPTSGKVREDPDHPVQRRMALVAIHVAYTLPNHPEFIRGTIQHVNVSETDPTPLAFAAVSILGAPDTQPDVSALPDPNDPQNSQVARPVSTHKYLLYPPGTPENQSLNPLDDSNFNEATQSFGIVTNVYRMFPGSRSNTLSPRAGVSSLNNNINELFANAIQSAAIDPTVDKRQHYRLVGALWMDKPVLFGLGSQNRQTQSYSGFSLQNDDQTNPLVLDAMQNPPNVDPGISQGVSCGTPTGTDGHSPLSGDVPGATAFNNTVPGCDTRYDDLLLPDAGNPTPGSNGGPQDPGAEFASHTIGTDSPFSILGGEDRLSSTAMETFTQNDTFHNCFSCHNTQPINEFGVSADLECLPPSPGPGCPRTIIPFAAKINVSRLFSEFVQREQSSSSALAPDAGH